MAATRARAKAEAVRARTTFVQREAEVLLEKAKLESELLSLQHKKEVAAASKEAEILEVTAAEIESGEINMAMDVTAFPQETVEKRTKDLWTVFLDQVFIVSLSSRQSLIPVITNSSLYRLHFPPRLPQAMSQKMLTD